MVRQNIERFRTKLADLRIPPDIRYVWMTDIERALTIYGHRANLLNNKTYYRRKFWKHFHGCVDFESCVSMKMVVTRDLKKVVMWFEIVSTFIVVYGCSMAK